MCWEGKVCHLAEVNVAMALNGTWPYFEVNRDLCGEVPLPQGKGNQQSELHAIREGEEVSTCVENTHSRMGDQGCLK